MTAVLIAGALGLIAVLGWQTRACNEQRLEWGERERSSGKEPHR